MTLLVVAVVALATSGFVLTRPPTFEARSALLAQPVTQTSPTGETFNGFVSLALPALVEFVHSGSALADIRKQVPGAPSAEELGDALTVELTPGTGVATIIATHPSRETAEGLARAAAAQVVAAGLLRPVANLRLLDAVPTVRELRPGPPVAAALGLGAGIAAAVALLAALQLWRPTPTSRLRQSLDDAGIGHPVILVDTRDEHAAERFAALGAVVHGRARLLPVAATDIRDTAQRLLVEGGIAALPEVSATPDKVGTAVIAVADRAAAREDLAGTWSSLQRPTALVAVVID